MARETIFALASARGKAGVAVVRLSGPEAWNAVAGMVRDLPAVRVAGLRDLIIAGEMIDQVLILLFEENKSFTGQRVAEIHLHGSHAIVARVLRHLGELPGVRLAEAGEFSRRALENGRLDLAQIEGLGDLIDAETEMQRRQAMRVFAGDLKARISDWRQNLVTVLALLMAGIDFADEEIPTEHGEEILKNLDVLRKDFQSEINGFEMSERVRDGFEVAILGVPNVGKSTLMNAIVGRRVALTSARAGTTRDVIEARLDLGGLAVTLLDTAGLRESDDEVEQLGIALARERAERADLRVFLTDGEILPPDVAARKDDLIVVSKADLRPGQGLRVSGMTGAGVDGLLARIRDILERRVAGASLITRERHRSALERAAVALDSAIAEIGQGVDRPEVIAEYLRGALNALDVIIGKIDVEDVLGEVFSKFCVGK